MGGGAHGARRRDLHAVDGHDRAHAVQPGDRRHREGPSCPGDRRARRPDGHARSTRPRSSSSCSTAAADPPCGRRARRPTSASTARGCGPRSSASRTSRGSSARPAGFSSRTAASPASRMEDGDAYRCDALVVTTGTFLNGLVHVGRDQKPAGRAGEPPSRDLAESLKSFGFSMGPAEDRHPAAAPPAEHRLLALRRGARRRAARAVLVPDAARSIARRSPVTWCTRRSACTRSCASTSRNRRSSTARSPASARATARRSKTR